MPLGRKLKRNRRDIWSNDWEFSKINEKYQTVDLGSSENTKKDKYKKKINVGILYSNCKKSKAKKKKILKETRGKNTCRGGRIRIISDFSSGTMHAKREWSEMKCWKKKKWYRIFYLANLFFISEKEIKNLSEKQKLGEFMPVHLPC